MTHRHRVRRGGVARASEKDMRTWSRLLTRADAVRGDGGERDWAFERAAARASKAILPAGHQNAHSPFVRLVRLGAGFPVLAEDARQERRVRIAATAAECRAAMARIEAGETGGREPRRDVFG